MGFYIKLQKPNATNNVFSSPENSLINYLSIQCKAWSSDWGHHFNFWNSWVCRDCWPCSSNSFWVYTHSSQDILVLIFCTSLKQCKVKVGCKEKTSIFWKFSFQNFLEWSLCNQLYWSTEVKSFEIFWQAKLDIFANPAGNSEGFDEKKWKIQTWGGGWRFFGIPRVWKDNTFWKFQRQRLGGRVRIWKASVEWYRYFLESPSWRHPCLKYKLIMDLTSQP